MCLQDKLTDFELKVLEKLKKVSVGRVTTYGELAKAVNCPKASRAVGNIMHKNPWAPKVPCHRVVKSNGQIGGYAAGTKKKVRLLEKEGVKIKKGKIENFRKVVYNF